jgi:FemAB-related protein (PEP-CTERM system-associated)
MANPSLETSLPVRDTAGRISSNPIIRKFEDVHAARWDEFVLGQPEGSFLHLTGWKRVIERTLGYQSFYWYAERNGEITAVLPLFLIENWIVGKCLHSVPFGVYGGICAADDESRHLLLAHVKKLAVEQQVDYVDLHQRGGEIFSGFHHNELYSVFSTSLSADHEANLKKIPRDTRYMIRKSEKTNLRAQHGPEQMKDFYLLFSESMKRLGTPVFPRALFENILEEFGQKIDLMVVYSGNQPVSAVLSFYHRNAVLPYYAGANALAQRVSANNFMYWHLMKDAVEKGFRSFDFGRSKKNTGAYAFKLQWGMTVEPLQYQVYLVRRKTLPNFSPTNPKFDMATKAWQKLPLGLTRALGPSIVRWFP